MCLWRFGPCMCPRCWHDQKKKKTPLLTFQIALKAFSVFALHSYQLYARSSQAKTQWATHLLSRKPSSYRMTTSKDQTTQIISQRKSFRKLGIDPAIDTDGEYLMPTNSIAFKTMIAVSFGPQDSMDVVDPSSIQDS